MILLIIGFLKSEIYNIYKKMELWSSIFGYSQVLVRCQKSILEIRTCWNRNRASFGIFADHRRQLVRPFWLNLFLSLQFRVGRAESSSFQNGFFDTSLRIVNVVAKFTFCLPLFRPVQRWQFGNQSGVSTIMMMVQWRFVPTARRCVTTTACIATTATNCEVVRGLGG